MDTIYNNPNDYWLAHPENGEQPGGGCLVAICYAMAFAAIMVLLCMFSACTTTREVVVPEVHEVHHHDYDSVYMHDSTYHERETIVMQLDSEAMAQYGIQLQAAERAWLVRSRELERQVQRLMGMKASIDSVRDSIPVPYPVEVQVPAELTWWQKTRMHCGEVLLIAVLAGIVYAVWKMRKKI